MKIRKYFYETKKNRGVSYTVTEHTRTVEVKFNTLLSTVKEIRGAGISYALLVETPNKDKFILIWAVNDESVRLYTDEFDRFHTYPGRYDLYLLPWSEKTNVMFNIGTINNEKWTGLEKVLSSKKENKKEYKNYSYSQDLEIR